MAAVVILLVGVVFLVGVGSLVWGLFSRIDDAFASERCVARGSAGDEWDLDPEQAGHAGTIAAVGARYGMPERGIIVAFATAIQESKLRNLDHGDRDSLGLFQQRPSQGWGTAQQVRDPVYASEKFFTALREVSGWQRMPVTVAAQKVQRSGFPDAYADHEDEAATLAAAFTGRVPGALTCTISVDDVSVERLTASGLTPRAAALRRSMERAFGKQSLGGFEPGGVSTGHIKGSAHYEGRAVDVFYRPVTAANKKKGWATAHWMVANAAQLRIATVIFDDRIWTARRAKEGWRAYVPSEGDPDNPITRHLDHVHVDVLKGG